MRKVLSVAAALAVGTALSSCSAPPSELQSSAGVQAYEPPGPVVRAPLPPPSGYASHAGAGGAPATPDGWRASPRWSAVTGDGCIEVEPDPRAGAGKVKVETCAKPRVQTPE